MPVARYFLYVGGVLLALLFVMDAIVPRETVVANTTVSSPSFDKSTVRIHSTQKLPERVVYDTSLPTVVPPQATVVAAAPAVPATPDLSARARVRDTFAQFIPAEAKSEANKSDSKKAPADAKPLEQQAQAVPAPAPKKRKIARAHSNPPTQLQPTRYAQPGQFKPFRMAQQQPRFGFFSGFGTW